MDFLKLAIEVGFPIAAACAGGFFVFLTLKFILASVTGDVKKISGIIEALDNRVKTMNGASNDTKGYTNITIRYL